MSFSESSTESPPGGEGCLHVREIGEESILALETEMSRRFDLVVGEPIGDIGNNKFIPIFRMPN